MAKLTLAKYQAEKHLKHEIILFDNCEVEEGRGDTAEGEASPEHEADTEQTQGQDVTQGEQEAGADHEIAEYGLEGNVVGEAEAVHHAGHQLA